MNNSDIWCAVLEKDCTPHYFDSHQKAADYIIINGKIEDEEQLNQLRRYDEIDDIGYMFKIVIE